MATTNAEAMLLKAQLAEKISEIISQRQWTQQYAAEVLKLTQPKLSMLLRGQFRGISETKMLACLTRLGLNVQIVVSPAKRMVDAGQMEVVFAG